MTFSTRCKHCGGGILWPTGYTIETGLTPSHYCQEPPSMLREKYFVKPPRKIFTSGTPGDYAGKFYSYSNYNYLRPGLISRIKRSRFDVALRLTEAFLHQGMDAIDFGCADGVFLPSLAKYFRHVVGVDNSPKFIDLATSLVKSLGLSNVSAICNAGTSFEELRARLPRGNYQIAYLLETLEHIGPEHYQGTGLYEAKIDFLNKIFSLMPNDGIIVISVPKMVGLPFLVKHLTQVTLCLPRERFTLKEITDATVFRSTEELERRWCGAHAGFNHVKLEEHLHRAFVVERVHNSFVTAFYIVRRRD